MPRITQVAFLFNPADPPFVLKAMEPVAGRHSSPSAAALRHEDPTSSESALD